MGAKRMTDNKASAGKSGKKDEKAAGHPEATRETVESIVIAVILAFLFRGFVAEAFVIPTGSMAPTLQGRHLDVVCPECHYQYRTGASEENERGGPYVSVTYCPLCRFALHLDRRGNPNHRSFDGDRILVGKFSYEWSEPQRWDVIVFKYPYNAKQNYIKRLVGLPNELVRIRHGDVYVAPRLFDWQPSDSLDRGRGPLPEALRQKFRDAGRELSDEAWWAPVRRQDFPLTSDAQRIRELWEIRDREQLYLWRAGYDGSSAVYGPLVIARKPPRKEEALSQLVYDTGHVSETLQKIGWPHRWRNAKGDAWQTNNGRSYRLSHPTSDWAWLEYRHSYPESYEWTELLATGRLPNNLVRPDGELISDYYCYNDRELSGGHGRRRQGMHWVGDLAVECLVNVESSAGELMLRLVEGGAFFDCHIDLSSGQVELRSSEGYAFIDERGREVGVPKAATPVKGPGKYCLRFSNYDDQLRLWVNGRLVSFSQPTTYRVPGEQRPVWSAEDPGDLAPARIALKGASGTLERIWLWRDVYYLAMTSHSIFEYQASLTSYDIERTLRTPELWSTSPIFAKRPTAEFVVPADGYLPLGDNSPESLDARMWGRLPYLERDLLIGEAILIYFPHAWRGPFFPLYWPNFQRMGLIH
ncbi:MAG: hypothetical protein KatS3mg110_1541 [Pirellulaceae bacterium]|nr:MAG: hypothetical protein KatS3mg110_1541 [Pirellulaceae bacterium]